MGRLTARADSLFADFVPLYIGLSCWWIALLVFSDIIISASGGFIMLLFGVTM